MENVLDQITKILSSKPTIQHEIPTETIIKAATGMFLVGFLLIVLNVVAKRI